MSKKRKIYQAGERITIRIPKQNADDILEYINTADSVSGAIFKAVRFFCKYKDSYVLLEDFEKAISNKVQKTSDTIKNNHTTSNTIADNPTDNDIKEDTEAEIFENTINANNPAQPNTNTTSPPKEDTATDELDEIFNTSTKNKKTNPLLRTIKSCKRK
ncbi:hypothetical protein [Clostridium tyrobutyricum]|jgi:uncharacterized protein YrzB (UPF0473 family)|uniref:hypothetical protein n=1 Tax=Clostridium tyrobutyricum TaxID=1519 RepID=UPI000E7E2E0C|nr:hypothetical protein [Clostridium tyrobutyricum]HBF76728.1 hypothetical protein [Clostridiaceae bacterium]